MFKLYANLMNIKNTNTLKLILFKRDRNHVTLLSVNLDYNLVNVPPIQGSSFSN